MSVLLQNINLGGIDAKALEQDMYDAFVIFGPIKFVELTKNGSSAVTFAHVTFYQHEDAKAAIDNMHMNELFGNTITCNFLHAS